MELERICITGIINTYAISCVKKEFQKAADEYVKGDKMDLNQDEISYDDDDDHDDH